MERAGKGTGEKESERRCPMLHAVRRLRRAGFFSLLLLAFSPVRAADHLSSAQVRTIVADAHGGGADLSGKDMSGDDLSGLDLSNARLADANLTGANLHGVKLVGADLTGADLSSTNLTGTWIMRANFTRASLRGATMKTVVTSMGMENTREQAATFVDADLSGASITVHFSFDDMRRANFSHADMTVVMANQSMGLLRTEFNSANLQGANFSDAGLGHVTFRFAKLQGARFNGADLTDTDFTGAYLTGADFTGAKLKDTNFDSAILADVKGLAPAR